MPHVLVNIKNDDVAQVIGQLSTVPPDTLIVFVHGWGGSAIETWKWVNHFLERTPPAGVDFDALFYGYDALRQSAFESAEQFGSFFNGLLDAPANFYEPLLTKALAVARAKVGYKRIVICCHSLGAPVVRRALLDLWKSDGMRGRAPWMDRIRLVLFAPAHRGARPLEIAREIGSLVGWLVPVRHIAKAILPSLRDMEPDSKFLTLLAEESKLFLDERTCPEQIIKAYRVYWAPNDLVVWNERFHHDEPAHSVPNATHSSLCKADAPDAFAYLKIKEALS